MKKALVILMSLPIVIILISCGEDSRTYLYPDSQPGCVYVKDSEPKEFVRCDTYKSYFFDDTPEPNYYWQPVDDCSQCQ